MTAASVTSGRVFDNSLKRMLTEESFEPRMVRGIYVDSRLDIDSIECIDSRLDSKDSR